MPAISRILMIEDEESVIKAFGEVYALTAVVVTTTTLIEAEVVIDNMANTFDIVIIDACLGGNSPNTLRLPARIRETKYKGPIVGFSSEPQYLGSLKGAGCDTVCHKAEIFRVIDKLLQEPRPISGPPSGT